jgi:ABC-type Mn2+/Zn2+ transport system ATPase subunit
MLLWKFFLRMRKKGKAIVLTTHNLNEAEKFCDEIAILIEFLPFDHQFEPVIVGVKLVLGVGIGKSGEVLGNEVTL